MELEDIKHLASLARIRVTDAEAVDLKTDIESVLSYVSVVNDIAAEGDLTKKVGARYNVFRADAVTNEPGSFTEDLLGGAPATDGHFLKVKKILNQD